MRTQEEWQIRERELLETTNRYLERARMAERHRDLFNQTLLQILNGQAIITGKNNG